jgi:hypothetical protein
VTNKPSRELSLSLPIAVDSAFNVPLIWDTFVSFVTLVNYILSLIVDVGLYLCRNGMTVFFYGHVHHVTCIVNWLPLCGARRPSAVNVSVEELSFSKVRPDPDPYLQ